MWMGTECTVCTYRTRSYCASNKSHSAEAWPTVSNLRCAGKHEEKDNGKTEKENKKGSEWETKGEENESERKNRKKVWELEK